MFDLRKLCDVLIVNPINGQVLTYDAAVRLWKNAAGSGGGSYSGSAYGIIAHVGGGQGLATSLTKRYNRVDTTSSDGDSAIISGSALLDDFIEIINNDTSHYMDLFPYSGNNFLGLAPNVAIPIPAGGKIILYCFIAGEWTQIN